MPAASKVIAIAAKGFPTPEGSHVDYQRGSGALLHFTYGTSFTREHINGNTLYPDFIFLCINFFIIFLLLPYTCLPYVAGVAIGQHRCCCFTPACVRDGSGYPAEGLWEEWWRSSSEQPGPVCIMLATQAL